jgi:hypothetical protein
MFLQVLITALSPLLRAGTLQTDDTVSLFLSQDVEVFPAHYQLLLNMLAVDHYCLLVNHVLLQMLFLQF